MDLAVLVETFRQGGSATEGPYRWNPRQEGLREAVRRLLAHYDRVLLLLSGPPLGNHLPLGVKLTEEEPRRVLLHPTPLFGPGLEALAERAEEMARSLEPEEVVEELRRVEREGRFYLFCAEAEGLRRLGWLPPAGGFVLRTGFWAAYAFEGGTPRMPPLPVPTGRLLPFLADLWAKAFPERRVRVYVHLGPGAEAFREELPRILRGTLKAERGRIAALEVNLKEALGPKTLVGFAYPLPEA